MSSYLEAIILFLPCRYSLLLPGSCLWGETESDLWCELPSRVLSFIDISWFWFRDDLYIYAFFTFSSASRESAAYSVQRFVTPLLYLGRYWLKRYSKRVWHEIVHFRFFHEAVYPWPLSIPLGTFQIFTKICGDVCNFDNGDKLFTGVNDTGDIHIVQDFYQLIIAGVVICDD
jgi:hypothetical protein